MEQKELTKTELKTLKRIVAEGQMIYSTRMHERLGRLREMGLIVYEESEGKLIAEPTSAAYDLFPPTINCPALAGMFTL